MALQLVVEFVWRHCPRFFSEFLDEGVLFDCDGGESFDKAEFALVVEVESAGGEMEDDAGLFVREICCEIVAGVAGGETVP